MIATHDFQQMESTGIDPTLMAIPLNEIHTAHLPKAGQKVLLKLHFSDFQLSQISSLGDLRYNVEDNLIAIKFPIDKDVLGVLELKGQLGEDGRQFKTDVYFFRTELVENTPRADFVSSTFKALLGLSLETHLQISEIGLDGRFRFVFELYQISKMLQLRQIAYRLMVIEQATGESIQLPKHLSANEQETITFIYRAIVERSFMLPVESFYIPLIANKECLNWFINFLSQSPMTLPGKKSVKNLFGKKINLGQETVTIIDGVLENLDKVKQELALNNGDKVSVEIRSLIGQIKIELPFAPRLPVNAWDSNIQSLIDLESQLDNQLVERYNDLAAATLAGLTKEEIAEVTARPELNFGVPDNEDGE
jgi:hypothetical protein